MKVVQIRDEGLNTAMNLETDSMCGCEDEALVTFLSKWEDHETINCKERSKALLLVAAVWNILNLRYLWESQEVSPCSMNRFDALHPHLPFFIT